MLDAARVGRGGRVEGDDWAPEMVLAHVVVADRLLAGAAAQVLAEGHASFDSRASHSEPYLEAIIAAAAGWEGLLEAVKRGGLELAETLELVSPQHAAMMVQARVLDAEGVASDSPTPLEELVTAAVFDHLPGHTEQLESYGAGSREDG